MKPNLFFVLLVLAVAPDMAWAEDSSDRPNIIFLMTDDQR
jgi:hypothetical protein